MSEDLIQQIAMIRARNNGSWMALLELALKVAPVETRVILQSILENDRRVCEKVERLLDQ